MIRTVLIPFICVFVSFASLILDKSPRLWLLSASVVLLSTAVIYHKRIPYAFCFQLLFLALFHWASKLNWSESLYFLLIILNMQKKPTFLKVIPYALGFALLYTFIRLSYVPLTKYNLLVSFYDILSFVIIVLFVQYVFNTEWQKRQLQKRNQFLTNHDPLTRLYNYDGFVHSVNQLIRKKNSPFILLLLDFQDFRSVNHVSISSGNELLMNTALLLQTYFPNAVSISRYAGDRFALVLPEKENTAVWIRELLDSKTLGYEVTYSLTHYPREASSPQSMISLAEDRLFQEKRKLWLKREEDRFRTEKLKIVGELAAGMAHEIRNPLTTMKGFIQLAKSQNYNIQPWFDIIMNEIRRMSELTAEFLQFSKPHISNMKPEAVNGCLERAWFLTESQAVSKGHLIHLANVDDTVLVHMDRDKIIQVLLNLIRNALEAMDEPGHIYMEARAEGSDIVIAIEDTGSGIPDSELGDIFTPFYTTKENGTGLGLSVCYKIIQDHGGSLTVRSKLGEGSVFIIRLPLVTLQEIPGESPAVALPVDEE
ncbi:ATP-binding protein [Paenibacillus aurantius]|uniref:histidine kinase n=1 Tax=Paenibacillus aurantius TaxID=2918900 RepID=A0AA96LAN0_9BACL|nr:ATP-binding protein [Paenibacillus aurantius]WNQ10117.1 ATP-binding protein [Paenibacillus aurantius]